MTKFTIEDLRDIAYRGSYDDLERELALQLLASMEQAPVYLRPFGDDGETFVACDGNDERAITLYAAPQLPQPTMTELEQFAEFMAAESIKSGDYPDGWQCKASNAAHEYAQTCRAAMLHGAEPVQGWIPCSERMPTPKTGVMVGCWFGREWAVKWATYLPYHPDANQNGFLMPGGSWTPTHWMPLPAAPQQEA